MQLADPTPDAYFPAPHAGQLALALGEDVPASHSAQAVADSFEKLPAAHVKHAKALVAATSTP